MNRKALFQPFTSFRAQLTAFIAATLLATLLIISIVNQRLERRTTDQVEEYIRAITLANDLIYQSFPSDKYLYELVNQAPAGDTTSLTVNADSIIQRILVLDKDHKIINSSARDDIGKQLPKEISQLPALRKGDIRRNADAESGEEELTMTYSLETDKGMRTNSVIISLNRLQLVKESVERDRLAVLVGLGLLLIFVIAVFSKRLTQPIVELGEAAHRVAAGQLDFKVPISGPQEVSRLTATFNEMLAGLQRSRHLEEQLQRAERSAMVGRLASGIAHEIRNPLNFINLSIDHLREAFAPPAAPERATYTHILTTIKDEIARLNRLVSDFLSYGRPAKLKPREVDARGLIEEVRDLLQTQATQQNVRINIEQTGAGRATLHADAEQLKTCFSNVMINAVQAMPEGGALNITLRIAAEQINIDFTDTDSGMAPEVLTQIFEPYFSTKETGVGLGLPLTKKIIEEHGGRISVVSEVGEGTTFTIILPRAPHKAGGQ